MKIIINEVKEGAAAGTKFASVIRQDGYTIGNIQKVVYNFSIEHTNFLVEAFGNRYKKEFVRTIRDAIACIFNVTEEEPAYEVLLDWADEQFKGTGFLMD